MLLGSAHGKVTLDASGVSRGVANAKNSFTSLAEAGKRMGSTLKNVGQGLTTFVTLPLLAAGGASIKMASDLGETKNKVAVIFGEMSEDVLKWSENSATALGQSQQEALDGAATFGVFGKAANLAGEDLAKFAQENVNLASDMASFFNTSPEEAITAIGAAFRGETEPIRQYGVMINQAAIEAKALQMGLLETSVSMGDVEAAQSKMGTSQEKWNDLVKEALKDGKITNDQYKELSQAIYNLDEASNAGQVGTEEWNTAIEDSLDIWRNYSSLLGEDGRKALLGYADGMEGVEKAMAGSTSELTQQQKILAVNALIMEQTTDAAGDFAETSDGLANSQRIMTAQLKDAAVTIGQQLLPYALRLVQFVSDLLTKFKALTPEQQKWIVVIGLILAGIGPLLMMIGTLITVISTVIGVIGAITAPVLIVIAVIAALIAIGYLLYQAWINNWGGIQEKTAAVMTFVRGVIDSGIDFIHKLTTGKLGAMSKVWDTSWKTIKSVVDLALKNLKLLTDLFHAAQAGDWTRFGQILRQMFDNMVTAWKTIFTNGWENIKTIFSAAWEWISNLFTETDWGAVGQSIIEGLVYGLESAAGWLYDALAGIVQAMIDIILGIFSNPATNPSLSAMQITSGNTSQMPKSNPKVSGAATGATGGYAYTFYGPVTFQSPGEMQTDLQRKLRIVR